MGLIAVRLPLLEASGQDTDRGGLALIGVCTACVCMCKGYHSHPTTTERTRSAGNHQAGSTTDDGVVVTLNTAGWPQTGQQCPPRQCRLCRLAWLRRTPASCGAAANAGGPRPAFDEDGLWDIKVVTAGGLAFQLPQHAVFCTLFGNACWVRDTRSVPCLVNAARRFRL